MTQFKRRLRANAIAAELCSNADDIHHFVKLALILEEKLSYDDLDEEAIEKIISNIQAKHKKMTAYINRVSRMIDQRRLARVISRQASNETYRMVIVMILMIWFDKPRDTPSPRH